MRQAIGLARKAREAGNEPFGALLVCDGTVVATGENRVHSTSNPIFHAELGLINEYFGTHRCESLENFTIYSSAEPCVMCSGAILWSRISRVVYSVAQDELKAFSGGRSKPSCESIVNLGKRHVEVVGGVLLDEGLALFEGFDFGRKKSSPVT